MGAVAIDKNGKLAAATSTGGQFGKMVGRSSDTSLIGCGTYADDNIGAVSTTGILENVLTKYNVLTKKCFRAWRVYSQILLGTCYNKIYGVRT